MSRPLLITLLLLGGCAPTETVINNTSVDIGAAAHEAQGTVNAYGEDLASDRAPVQPARDTPVAEADTPLPEPTPRAPGAPGGLPDDRTPISEAPFTPDSAQGAANVVQTYYALIGEGRYAQARALWEPGAAGAGATAGAFAADFGRYSSYRGLVGAPGAIDAGAGQRYVTVPVQITARAKSGAVLYQIGRATLHRAGDIDGASPAQRTWRLRSIDLRTAPDSAPTPASSPSPAATPVAATTVRYRCIDGSRLTVAYDPARNTATVRSGGKLEGVLRGQGRAATYQADGFELRGSGDRVRYTRPAAPPLACATR